MRNKRKKMVIIVALLVLVVMFVVAILGHLRYPILKGKLASSMRPWVELFWPPSDLYVPLLLEEIDVATEGSIYTFPFELKYIGLYTGGILLKNFSSEFYWKKRDLALRMRFEFSSDHGDTIVRESSVDYMPFRSRIGNGLSLIEFAAPEDLPIESKIKCTVIVLASDSSLVQEFGPLKLYITRRSKL